MIRFAASMWLLTALRWTVWLCLLSFLPAAKLGDHIMAWALRAPRLQNRIPRSVSWVGAALIAAVAYACRARLAAEIASWWLMHRDTARACVAVERHEQCHVVVNTTIVVSTDDDIVSASLVLTQSWFVFLRCVAVVAHISLLALVSRPLLCVVIACSTTMIFYRAVAISDQALPSMQSA